MRVCVMCMEEKGVGDTCVGGEGRVRIGLRERAHVRVLVHVRIRVCVSVCKQDHPF